MSAAYESADLIMKLYDLRREETMRKARDWFITFSPQSLQDVIEAVNGEQSAYYRMVTSYWDMAASFVNNGAIDAKMFQDANSEYMAIYAKIEPFVAEIRTQFQMPQYLIQLEQMISNLPNARERLATVRARMQRIAEARAAKAK